MDDKSTVLHVAAAHGMAQVVQALLDAGACTWVLNLLERTPLEEAIHSSHLDICQLFLQHKQLGHVHRIREHERWEPIRGWGNTFPGHLLPTDIVDNWVRWRLGREGNMRSLPPVHSSMKAEKIAPLQILGHTWAIDLLTDAVDKQGYRYALDFWKFAAGLGCPASTSTMFVRYRTWTQVPRQPCLGSLAEDLRHRVEIKTRANFSKCFLAHDAVACVMELKQCLRETAVHYCQVLERAGYFHHVINARNFDDSKRNFRFYKDEDSSLQSLDADNYKIEPWMVSESMTVKLVATSGIHITNAHGSLQARSGFPSIVAANVVLETGKWYYEVSVEELGSEIQVGWATVLFTGREKLTLGVGDDNKSWAFDAHGRKWHQHWSKAYGRQVQEGGVIGVAVDLDEHVCSYSLNGDWTSPMGEAFKNVAANIRPAITLQSKASVAVNFGPNFKHSPPTSFQAVSHSKIGEPIFSLDTHSLVVQNRERILRRYPDLSPDFAERCCIQSGDILAKLSKQQHDPENPYLLVVYENERFIPGTGWSSDHLSSKFSDPNALTGNHLDGDYIKAGGKIAILPAADWSWTTDWKIVNEDSGENGWQYSTSFWSQATMSPSSLGKCVRQRRWQRQMCFTEQLDAELSSSISLPVIPQHGKAVRLRTTAGEVNEMGYLSDRSLVAKSGFPSVVPAQYGEHGLRDLLLTKDKWYYEIEVLEKGHAQIGWAKADFTGFDKISEFMSDRRAGLASQFAVGAVGVGLASTGAGIGVIIGGIFVGQGVIKIRQKLRHRQERATTKGALRSGDEAKIGFGVGDDDMSWATDLDGRSWHCGGKQTFGKRVEKGDIIGCACDIPNGVISFSLNGSWVPPFGNAKVDLRLDAGVRPAVTIDSKAELRLNFGETPWAFEPPTEEFKKVMEASSCGPRTVLLQTDSGSTYGRLCSGCTKIAPITCTDYAVMEGERAELEDLRGRFAILHLNHDALSMHHISACIAASALVVIIVNTNKDSPERLVDFGVYPPVSFSIPIITVSYASGRMLQFAGSIHAEMALPRTQVLEQRSPRALSSFDEMRGRIDHYSSQLQTGLMTLFVDGRYTCTYLQRTIVDEAKTIFMERMVDKMPSLISVDVDGSASLDLFQDAVRTLQSSRGSIDYEFLFGKSGTKEQCYAMLGQRGGTVFHTAPVYSLDNSHLGVLYCVLGIVLTGLVHPVENESGFEEVPLDYDSCKLSSQGKFRIANSDQALKMFCIGFKFLPAPRMLAEYEPATSLIDPTDWRKTVPACADCIAGLLQNVTACDSVPEMQRVAREVRQHTQDMIGREMQGPLPPNELSAIVAYTHDLSHEAGIKQGNLYYELNMALRKRGNQQRQELKEAWGDYNHFLMSGLSMLPLFTGYVYRSVNFPQKIQAVEAYGIGKTVQWGGYTSTATVLGSAKGFYKQESILFKIKVHSGHDICKYSYVDSENEVLLSPECSFQVASAPYESDGCTMIDLEELINEALLFS
jgi:hypothetical protein